MRLPPRSVLIVLAAAVLNLGTLHSWGFYTPSAFLAVVLAWGLGVLALRANPSSSPPQRREILGSLFIFPLSWVFTLASLATPTLLYAEDVPSRFRVRLSASLGCLSVAALPIGAIWFVLGRRMDWWRQALTALIPVLTVVFGFTTRALTLSASPDPVIDVYPLLRDGADHILRGQNPYHQDIESPYGTARAAKFGVVEQPESRPAGYPPLPLLLATPPRWFGADVRWSNVVADVLAGLALAYLAGQRRWSFFGIVAMATYLNAVRVPFIIEQAWYEPMIAALLGWGLVLAEQTGRRRVLGHLLLGLGLTAKQFGLPLLSPLVIAFRNRWKLLAAGILVGAGLILPWFLASPADFLDIVLWKHLQRPAQYGSVTLTTWVHHQWGLDLPRLLGWLLAVALIAWISFQTRPEPADVPLSLGTVLLTFCLCHTQGYPNYFYLTQYLWLLAYVANLPKANSRHLGRSIAADKSYSPNGEPEL